MKTKLSAMAYVSVVVLALLSNSAYGFSYVRTTKSPYKSDPPGTYIETRSDGTSRHFRGGIEYKREDRKGHSVNVAPPTRYEVHKDGSLWKVEDNGLNSVGNRCWSGTKVADMVPDSYITKDENGNVKEYNVKQYLEDNGQK